MSHKYIIDTSVWVEYFGGTAKGEKAKNIVEQETIATSILAIAEIADKGERENTEYQTLIKFIQSRATILPLTIELCLHAAQLKKQMRKIQTKFGLADAIHLATAKQEKTIFLTVDNDFSGIDDVEIIH